MGIIVNLSRAALVAGLLATFGHQATAQKNLEAKISQDRSQKPDIKDYNFFSLYSALSSEENQAARGTILSDDIYNKHYKSLVLKFSQELAKLAGRYGISIDEYIDDASYANIGGIELFTFLDEIVLRYPVGTSHDHTAWFTLVFYPNDTVLEHVRVGGDNSYRRFTVAKVKQPDSSIILVPVSLPVNPDFPYQSDMKGFDFWKVHNRARQIRGPHYKSGSHRFFIENQFEYIEEFMFKRYGITPTSYNRDDDLLFAGGGVISISYYNGVEKWVLQVRDRPEAKLELVGKGGVSLAPNQRVTKTILPVDYIK